MTTRANPEEIYRSLQTILLPNQVTELRALNATEPGWRSPHTVSGYFSDIEAMTRAATNIQSAKGVYFVPNEVHPALLARAANRARGLSRGEPTTSDDKIMHRLWLLVDADPVRPDSYISATNEEHEAALCRAREIREHLAQQGWPDPIYADSGNGGHLMYGVSLPPDDDGLVQSCLAALAGKFSDDKVTIDQTVYNPARIWKLYGTVARKGDNTDERPHRLSRIIEAPAKIIEVKREQLRELAGTVPTVETSAHPSAVTKRVPLRPKRPHHSPSERVERWLREHQVEVARKGPWRDGYRWVLATCPMNPEHRDNSAYIVQLNNGALAAGCHHNSCRHWGWKELRQQTRSTHRFYELLAQLIEASAQLSDRERAAACGVLRRLGA